jgi:carbonic anhydrase
MTGCEAEKKETKEEEKKEEVSGEVYKRAETITSAEEAKKLLEEGNKRFIEDKAAKQDISSEKRKTLSTKGQKPFAIIVSCSDSRVPPELIFDQGLGDVFVVRVAGNVVDPIAIGSVEYAVEHLKAPYILVVGHEKCGAVKATVEGGEAPGSIGSIVEKIKPSVDKAKATGATGDELVEKAVDENVTAVIAELEKSPIVGEAIEGGKLTIAGAKYHIESGEVTWFESEKKE